MEEKPTAPVFPDIALFEKLIEFNATSEERVKKFRHMFWHKITRAFRDARKGSDQVATIEIFGRLFTRRLFSPLGCLYVILK